MRPGWSASSRTPPSPPGNDPGFSSPQFCDAAGQAALPPCSCSARFLGLWVVRIYSPDPWMAELSVQLSPLETPFSGLLAPPVLAMSAGFLSSAFFLGGGVVALAPLVLRQLSSAHSHGQTQNLPSQSNTVALLRSRHRTFHPHSPPALYPQTGLLTRSRTSVRVPASCTG